MADEVSIRDVKDVLAKWKLESPDLAALQATNQSYRALLMQPAGPVYCDSKRIGPLDIATAEVRSDSFLAMAAKRGDQLVITPEYFLPVASLRKAALGEAFPTAGALWVLGCESITPSGLAELSKECAGSCEVIYEDDPTPDVQGNYFDPVAYCFVTRDAECNYRRVILVQFKTVPSRDEHGFENKQLRCGRDIYQFHGKDDYIRLSTIICSDAFSIGEDLAANKKLSDRAVLIHIQLNPKPKHTDYRKYRNEVFSRSPTLTDCDIVCLNWAQEIVQHEETGKASEKWQNESGSAWYLPERRCSAKDAEVAKNEAKGLYYTRHEKKRHVLHFHYDEAVFALTVPKVVQEGAAVQDVLVGPILDARLGWDPNSNSWVEVIACPETGWSATLGANEAFTAAFKNLQDIKDRLNIERAISLSCGPHNINEQWHRADQLDLCRIGENEVVARATLRLDRDATAGANRHHKIGRVAALNRILQAEPLPLSIKDLAGGGAEIAWSPDSPNTNVTKPGHRPALVAYLGESPEPATIEKVGTAAFELLRRENNVHHRHRVAVCYRNEDGVTQFANIKPLTEITYDGSSMASITRGD